MAYSGGIDLIAGLRPKNNGAFPLVNAKDVYVDDDTRLNQALEGLATKEYVDNAVNATLLESISWEMLTAEKSNGKLVPGKHYRITDYVATVANDANAQSANHPFDIIVVADDESTLNEHARAVIHETVLDFAPGTQYAVGDFCKYDAKVYKCTSAHKGEWEESDFMEESPYFYNCDLSAWDVWYCLDNDTTRFAWADVTNGKGVVYRLVDEFQNDCPYDFKGIQFQAYGDTDNVWRYTFDSGSVSNNTDYSLAGNGNNIYANKINPYFDSGMQMLNCIVFKGLNCYKNTFGSNCYENTFGSGCFDNEFDSNCSSITFGSSCSSNTFGSYCEFNSLGSNCSSNTFGAYCENNAFGSECHYNTFGLKCFDNAFGSYCSSNTFGSDCAYITFGTDNATKSYCRYIRVASGNQYLYINPTGPTSSENYYQNVEIKEGVNNNTETYKTITDANINQTFLTTYKPRNSIDVEV